MISGIVQDDLELPAGMEQRNIPKKITYARGIDVTRITHADHRHGNRIEGPENITVTLVRLRQNTFDRLAYE